MIPYRNSIETVPIYKRQETETGDQTGDGNRDPDKTETKTRDHLSVGLLKGRGLGSAIGKLLPSATADRSSPGISMADAQWFEDVAKLPVEERTRAAAKWLASLDERPEQVIQALCNRFGLRALQACEVCRMAQDIRSAANA